jgi:hypothetical protein
MTAPTGCEHLGVGAMAATAVEPSVSTADGWPG